MPNSSVGEAAAKDKAGHEKALAKATKEKPLSLRERLFNFTNEKVRNATAKHEQLNSSIEAIKSQLGAMGAAIDESIRGNIAPRQEAVAQNQQQVDSAQAGFTQAVGAAQDANYRGYSV